MYEDENLYQSRPGRTYSRDRQVGASPALGAPFGETSSPRVFKERAPQMRRFTVVKHVNESPTQPDMGVVREKRVEGFDKGLKKAMKDDNYHAIRHFKKEKEIQLMYQAAERTYDRGDNTMTFEGNIRRFLNPSGY